MARVRRSARVRRCQPAHCAPAAEGHRDRTPRTGRGWHTALSSTDDDQRPPTTNSHLSPGRRPGADRDEAGLVPEQEPTAGLPLSGVRVIDVGTFLAGPYAASIMGEFGAEVIKVEHPISGDPMRRFGVPTKREDATLAWLSEARNRKSVTIDLRKRRGLELFLKLVAKSDVLVENFRPGSMESWGLGWDVLSEVNAGLVMLRVSGFCQTGPYRRRPGFAHVAHAFGGLSYLAGKTGEVGQAAEGMRDVGEARTAAVGAGLAETGDPEHDQAWVDLAEHVPAQAPGLHRAGAKVLHQDVALGDQLEEQLQAAPLSQVDGDRLAVAGLAEPGQRGVLALGRYAEAAHRVTGDRVLDLDDLGTELAHDAGGVGAGEERADVDDPYPAQRQPGGWLLLWHQAGLVSVRPGPTARGKVTVRRWWSLIVVRAAQGSVPAPTGPRSTVAMAFGRGCTMRGLASTDSRRSTDSRHS